MVSLNEAIISCAASTIAVLIISDNVWAAGFMGLAVWFAIRSVHRKIEKK